MIDDDTAEKHELPRKGDMLFDGNLPDWWNNASVNPPWGNPDHGYAEGYRLGAQLLVEHVDQHQRNSDYLVYPVVFLYRHHIELALKNALLHTPYLIDQPLSETEEQHLKKHRLDLLWHDLKPRLDLVCTSVRWEKLGAADVAGIESYIDQLTKFDPDSFGFRYSRTKKGTPSLPPELKHINLRNFAEKLERLSGFVGGLADGLSHLEDDKAEWEAECRNEAAQYKDYYE